MTRNTVLAAALALAVTAAANAGPAAQDLAPNDATKTPVPAEQGRYQPQGKTGPINTKSSGGAPAESPQGETPPGMQSAPEGSSKTTTGSK
ncbi:MAG: hypothetical protein U1E61_03805 [Bradyrhizobium sp.]